MKTIYCPRCRSSNITPYIAGITGSYRCNDCGYIGSLIIEKDFVKKMNNKLKK